MKLEKEFSVKHIFLAVLLFLTGIAAPAGRVPATENEASAIAACLPGKSFKASRSPAEVDQTFGILTHAFREAVFVEESEVTHQEPGFQGKEQKYSFLHLPPGILLLARSPGKINAPFKGENYLPHQFSRRYILFRSLLI